MAVTCACGAPIGIHSKTGRCRACARRELYRDPAARKVMSDAKKRAMRDPVKRERVAVAASENLRAWHRTTDRDWAEWHRRKRAREWAWCPAERRDEYRALRRLKYSAVEARQIIEDDERAKVRRAMRRTG